MGSGTLVSIHDVVQQLVHIINSDIEPLFGRVPDRPMEQVRVANIKNTSNEIGWKPITPLKKGLEFTAKWYRTQLYNKNEIDSPEK